MNSPSPPGASSSSSTSIPAFIQALSSAALWKMVGIGAAGALAGALLAEPLFEALLQNAHTGSGNIMRGLATSAIHITLVGLMFGAALLIWDNLSSLRGQWYRDLGPGLGLFAVLGLVGGIVAQFAYGFGMALLLVSTGMRGQGLSDMPPLLPSMLVRGLAWTVFGAGIGASTGILRGDKGQIIRGAVGGAIGGFLGGSLFDPIALAIHDTGSGVTSRLIGFMVWGAVAAGALRLIQETLRSAWLLGISTGPYEGKEYPLGKARLTVGRGNNCDLSLFRDESLAPQLGALVFQNGTWWWQGETITINGVPQNNAMLQPRARLQIGQTLFRFNDRSKSAPRDPLAPPVITGGSVMSGASPMATPMPATPVPALPPLVAWTFSPAIGNTLTGFRLDPETGTATIGRAAGNTWVLSDDGTSSRHARLDRTTDGLAITDLGSTNGTYINGQKLNPNVPVALRGSETVRIGRTQWMVRRGG